MGHVQVRAGFGGQHDVACEVISSELAGIPFTPSRSAIVPALNTSLVAQRLIFAVLDQRHASSPAISNAARTSKRRRQIRRD